MQSTPAAPTLSPEELELVEHCLMWIFNVKERLLIEAAQPVTLETATRRLQNMHFEPPNSA